MPMNLNDCETEAMDSSQQPRHLTYSSSSLPSDDLQDETPSSLPEEQNDIESGVGNAHVSGIEDDDLTEPQRQYPRNKKLNTRSTVAAFTSSLPSYHRGIDKVISLKDAPTLASARFRRQEFLRNQQPPQPHNLSMDTLPPGLSPRSATKTVTIEEKETLAREGEITNPVSVFYLSMVAAIKVMVCFLITAETVLTCMLTAGMIVYWYNYGLEHADGLRPWSGSGMEFVVLVFAVTTPIATAIGMAFTRREESLVMIADMRSSAHHLYIAHALWDWKEGGGRAGCTDFDFLEHCDAVLAQLVGIGDELSRFLTLPTTSRSRHRMTKAGRKEAARTVEVAYGLLESMTNQRMTRLSIYAERIKTVGLPSGEVSRIRQYERYLQTSIERLRMYKMYRTPQALRSFARIFTLLLPPFFAPKFAQVAIDVHSLGMGLALGLITTVVITALFETLEVLEDPFVGYLALDGIDVKEEFEVLLWTSLVKTRRMIFPDSPDYPEGRRATLNIAINGGLPTRQPSVIHIAGHPSPLFRGASIETSSPCGPVTPNSSLVSGVGASQVSGHVMEPTASELSFLSMQSTHRGDCGIYQAGVDEGSVEFGRPILEDPETEALLRQTNFQPDGRLVHHEKSKTRSSTSSLMGLVFRGNAGGGGGSRAPSFRSNLSK